MNRAYQTWFVMLHSRLLRPEEHARFAAFNQRNNGARVELTYLKHTKIRVFYRPEAPERWVAAYVINSKPPFRCLSVLDDAQRAAALRQHGMAEKQIVEITLLSRDHSIRWQRGERANYYATSIRDALKTGKSYLIGGTTDADKLKTQMIILDRILFDGDLNFFGTTKPGWLIYTSRLGAIKNVVRHLVTQLINSLLPKQGHGPATPLPNN